MNVAVINCFDTFLDRQNALLACFESRGHQVRAFLSDFQHVDKCYRTEPPQGYSLVHVPAYRKNLSLQRMRSHDRFAHAVLRQLEGERWDLIWAIVPPNSLVKACAAYKRTHPETKIVLDINDLWPESFPLAGFKKLPPFQLWRSLRDNYLSAADYIVTECELFRKKLSLQQSDHAATIYFCKPEEAAGLDRTPRLSENRFSVCYLGSMNHIIDIDAIVAILSSMKCLRPVRLHLIGAGESKQQLISSVKKAGVQVVDYGSVYDASEKQCIFNQCQFGLNVMKSTVCVGLTMKSIDYLAGGLPLINTIPGDTWDLIDQYGFGLNWDGITQPDWLALDQTKARCAARSFFEQELDYANFSQKVESVLEKL